MPKYWGKNYFAHGNFPEVGHCFLADASVVIMLRFASYTCVNRMLGNS